MITKYSTTRSCARVARRSPISVTLNPRNNRRVPNNFLQNRSPGRMYRNMKKLQNGKISNGVRRSFLSIIASESSGGNDMRNSSSPPKIMIPVSRLIPSQPNRVDEIDDSSNNSNFTLWRPMMITEAPYIIHAREL
jgi:hypothetical protein